MVTFEKRRELKRRACDRMSEGRAFRNTQRPSDGNKLTTGRKRLTRPISLEEGCQRAVGSEVRARSQIGEGLGGHDNQFGFFPEHDEKTLKEFKQRCVWDLTYFF